MLSKTRIHTQTGANSHLWADDDKDKKINIWIIMESIACRQILKTTVAYFTFSHFLAITLFKASHSSHRRTKFKLFTDYIPVRKLSASRVSYKEE